jgi:CubicO group peptidase (beta-lactamase class C family)
MTAVTNVKKNIIIGNCMNITNRYWFLILLCLLGNFTVFVHGQESVLDAAAEKLLKKFASESTSGFAILVARDGNVLLQTAGGMANISQGIAATVETKFRIGSVTKQFTAMAIVKLAEQGRLSLDDRLAKYYPDFPNAGEITLEHLLTHTSGLHSYTSKPDFMLRVAKPAKPASIINWSQKDSPDFLPGQKFAYCNTGYFLLGEIVATVSGKSYAEFLNDEFFVPLGMKNTGVYVNADPPEGAAAGYSLTDGKYEPALDWDMSWAGGAGALYSTVGDLFLWNEALFSGKVVSEASLKKATTPYALPAGVDAMNYGYGLFMAEFKRLPMISHSGGLNGWSSDLAYFPQQKSTIVVLTNAMPTAPELTPQTTSRKFAEIVLADVIKELPEMEVDATVDPQGFNDFVGKYDYQGAVAHFFVEDNQLFAQLTGQQKIQVFPKAKDHFFWKVVDAEVVFQRNDQGQVISARHTQNGITFTAPRIQETAVSEQELDAFVGKYRYGLAVMTTTREGNQLYAQLTGQPRFPIFPVNENTFQWRVVEAQVEFVKDENGKVVTARHTQNGTTFDAARIETAKEK